MKALLFATIFVAAFSMGCTQKKDRPTSGPVAQEVAIKHIEKMNSVSDELSGLNLEIKKDPTVKTDMMVAEVPETTGSLNNLTLEQLLNARAMLNEYLGHSKELLEMINSKQVIYDGDEMELLKERERAQTKLDLVNIKIVESGGSAE